MVQALSRSRLTYIKPFFLTAAATAGTGRGGGIRDGSGRGGAVGLGGGVVVGVENAESLKIAAWNRWREIEWDLKGSSHTHMLSLSLARALTLAGAHSPTLPPPLSLSPSLTLL